MELSKQINYAKLSDKQLVELILALPHNEEAAAYLLHERYHPLLRNIYRNITNDAIWYESCVNELHLHLRGKDCSWRILANFEWRSTLGCWLTKIAKNKFLEVLPKLIENWGQNLSLDNNDPEKSDIQIPDGGEEEYDRRMRKVMLMEAIRQLKDEEERLVIIKKLEGYNSKEIAVIIQKKWERLGIVKYGYKKDKESGDDSKRIKVIVVPDASYVDVRVQRAKNNLKIIMKEMV